MTELLLTVGGIVVLVLLFQASGRHEAEVTRVMVEEGLGEEEARAALWEREQW